MTTHVNKSFRSDMYSSSPTQPLPVLAESQVLGTLGLAQNILEFTDPVTRTNGAQASALFRQAAFEATKEESAAYIATFVTRIFDTLSLSKTESDEIKKLVRERLRPLGTSCIDRVVNSIDRQNPQVILENVNILAQTLEPKCEDGTPVTKIVREMLEGVLVRLRNRDSFAHISIQSLQYAKTCGEFLKSIQDIQRTLISQLVSLDTPNFVRVQEACKELFTTTVAHHAAQNSLSLVFEIAKFEKSTKCIAAEQSLRDAVSSLLTKQGLVATMMAIKGITDRSMREQAYSHVGFQMSSMNPAMRRDFLERIVDPQDLIELLLHISLDQLVPEKIYARIRNVPCHPTDRAIIIRKLMAAFVDHPDLQKAADFACSMSNSFDTSVALFFLAREIFSRTAYRFVPSLKNSFLGTQIPDPCIQSQVSRMIRSSREWSEFGETLSTRFYEKKIGSSLDESEVDLTAAPPTVFRRGHAVAVLRSSDLRYHYTLIEGSSVRDGKTVVEFYLEDGSLAAKDSTGFKALDFKTSPFSSAWRPGGLLFDHNTSMRPDPCPTGVFFIGDGHYFRNIGEPLFSEDELDAIPKSFEKGQCMAVVSHTGDSKYCYTVIEGTSNINGHLSVQYRAKDGRIAEAEPSQFRGLSFFDQPTPLFLPSYLFAPREGSSSEAQ